MVANLEIKHKSKAMLGVIQVCSPSSGSLLCSCMMQCPLQVPSTRSKIENALYITWFLLNVNNIWDLLKNAWKTP